MVDKSLAGNGDLGSFTPTQLFAGEMDVVTGRIVFTAGLVFAQFEPFAIAANGKAVKFDPAGAAPATSCQGITEHAIDTSASGTNADTMGPYYKGGCFNHEALVWPAATDTLAERQAAFRGANGNHNINIESIL